VQVYRETSELAESVATYLAAGFEAAEPAVVVVTAPHWAAIAEHLQTLGWEAGELEADGLLFSVDAEETLESIMDGGVPSPRRFTQIVGGLIDQATAGVPERRVRAFGEMVDLLCRRGQVAAADALEHLWNRLGAVRNFSLLCAYRIDVFDRASQVSLLPQVYRSHSEVLPGGDAERLDRALDAALIEILGQADAQKVYARATQHTEGQVPRAERALVWVSAHMPQAAERILATARSNYAASEAAA
jgi:hypothetical protein